jgi:putative restriction endonuclease
MKDIHYYLNRLVSLRVNTARSVSPHKPCLMLAVIDLYDTDPDRENRIYFEPTFIERYLQYFSIVGRDNQHPNPHLPFSRLWGDGFWHLVSNSDGARIDHRIVITSSSKLHETVSHAEIDSELHDLLKYQENRTLLAQTLVNHWFDRDQDEMDRLVGTSHQINLYERRIRSAAPTQMIGEAKLPAFIRDPAFRRVVLQAYDYRCAATAQRIILPDESVMVQAAHIVPFSESGNDDPCNGLALSPDMHWAMDKCVIAPGTDLLWHISGCIDRRFAENEPLLRLEGKELVLPREKRFSPKRQYLEWRMDNLMK